MLSLVESFPSLAAELSERLRAEGHAALADQIDRALIDRITFGEDVGYIYVQPSAELNAVEKSIMRVRHGGTIQVDTRYWTNIDTDNFGRPTGIEILTPGDIKDELRKHAKG